MPLARIHFTSRALKDLADCMEFVSRHSWGRPPDRLQDVMRALRQLCAAPSLHRIERVRKSSGIELRRSAAAQFVIIYAYRRPDLRWPAGRVSIRAIRHRRARDVFMGVREPPPPPSGWDTF